MVVRASASARASTAWSVGWLVLWLVGLVLDDSPTAVHDWSRSSSAQAAMPSLDHGRRSSSFCLPGGRDDAKTHIGSYPISLPSFPPAFLRFGLALPLSHIHTINTETLDVLFRASLGIACPVFLARIGPDRPKSTHHLGADICRTACPTPVTISGPS